MIKLVITDLDDTLYSWIGFFIPAFYDMVQELSLLINVPQEKLLEEYKAIHQEVGSVVYRDVASTGKIVVIGRP